jgi:hypothetical protein
MSSPSKKVKQSKTASEEVTPKGFISPTGAAPNSKQWLKEKKAHMAAIKKQEREELKSREEEFLFNQIHDQGHDLACSKFKKSGGELFRKHDYVSSFGPCYMIKLLLEHGYTIDIESLRLMIGRGLKLNNPEHALRVYESNSHRL